MRSKKNFFKYILFWIKKKLPKKHKNIQLINSKTVDKLNVIPYQYDIYDHLYLYDTPNNIFDKLSFCHVCKPYPLTISKEDMFNDF